MNFNCISCVLLLSTAFVGTALAQQGSFPLAKLTVHVLDEQTKPIIAATAKIWFSAQSSSAPAIALGDTDQNGEFTAEGHSDSRLLSTASKIGYYDSGSLGTTFATIKDGKWLPWNPRTDIILRPIGKPVALYAKTDWIEIPAVAKPCGYDLEVGDWTTPYGNGITADIVFTLDRRYESRDDFAVILQLRFTNVRDGIHETNFPDIARNSVFKWQREAPQGGYESTFTSRISHKPGGSYESTATETQAFFVRVRTIEKDGRIVSALYGKIRGGFQLAPSDSRTCKVHLTYYLNPTSLDRNLEWNTKHDLIQGLSVEQTPRDP